MPSLIAFDLDGTLVDSELDLADSTNAVLASYGAAALPVQEVASMVGEGAKVLVQRALRASGLDPDEPEALPRFHREYAARLTTHTRPYAGIPELLAALAPQARLAVLTNKPLAATERLLDALGLAPYFPAVLGGDSPFGRKPDPAGLRHLIARAGTTPERTVLVGDSAIDVETARRAGVRIVAALYGFGQARGDLVLEAGDWRAADVAALHVCLAAFLRS